jgi:ECF sigma factor
MNVTEDPSFASLYDQLRQIAQSALRRNGAHLGLSPTTLLHEVYLDISRRQSLQFPDRAHFMAYASRAMRGLNAARRSAAAASTSLPCRRWYRTWQRTLRNCSR